LYTYLGKVEKEKSCSNEEGYSELLGRWWVDSADGSNDDNGDNLGTFAEDDERVRHDFHCPVAKVHAAEVKQGHNKVILSEGLKQATRLSWSKYNHRWHKSGDGIL